MAAAGPERAGALEREVKLDAKRRFSVPDLSGVAPGVAVHRLPTVRLLATYHDTPDLRLLRRRITLRHREDLAGRSESGWTLKLPAGTEQATLARRELCWAGAVDAVPKEALALTRGIVRRAPVVVVARLLTDRQRVRLVGQAGQVLAEVDDDHVVVLTGAAQGLRFHEVEVELGEGDPDLLDVVIERLRKAGARPGRQEPKVRRAVGLAGPAGRAVRALGSRSSLADVVGTALAGGVDRLLDHEYGIRLDEPDREYVHQSRVATRRLRSDLRTFAAVLDRPWVEATRAELRWLGGALGAVRDADVLGERLVALAVSLGRSEDSGTGELLERLGAQRRAAMADLEGVLDSERYLDLVDRLDEAAGLPPFAARGSVDPWQPAAGVLAELARDPWRKLRQAVRRAGPNPTDADLHRVRIRAKQLRYAAEAAAPVVGRPARRLGEAAADLQTVLGDHHDAVAAEAWLAEASFALPAAAEAAEALAAEERRRQDTCRHSWRTAWASVRRHAPRKWLR